jgi:uroporphyrin-III C-methyltransferase / precorrin-2 dehydrogenase / sirohydrochlorin ferrochelatase
MSSDARLSVFPAFHKVAGRPVLVVGEGAEAAAKVRLLLETQANIRVVASRPESALAALIIGQELEHLPRAFREDDVDGAVLAFAASGDRALDEQVVAAARARGVPANAVDVPELCDFYTPSIVNRAPVAVAVTTAGDAPVLAQKIRAKIEALLPPRLGPLASLAGAFRGAADKLLPKGQPRRRFWSRLLEGPAAEAALAGRSGEAHRLAARLLARADGEAVGLVSIVGAGPGATDLLTLRAQRALQEADVIVHDRLVPEAVVAMGRRDAERIDVGKAKGRHSRSQDEINDIMVAEAKAGRRVVRLKGGDPLVFGRAGEEMAALRQAGVSFEVVPGITAALAAAAEAEIPLTLRGVASSLVFATGHSADGDALPGWTELALSGATVAVYMARTVAAETARQLIEAGLATDTPVALVANASRADRRLFAGTLADLASRPAAGVDGPTLILIGPALAQGALAEAEPLRQAEAIAA